jgi:hypothetical protein
VIGGTDSAQQPSAASVAAAAAAGVRVWAGYFAGRNILNGWAKADFDRVRAGGLATFAFCSGFADPAQMAAQADAWGVPICLDVEGGIRGDGPWVQGWLDTASAGLYGNAGVHPNRTAPFNIIALYPGADPGATWPGNQPRPTGPCGWQWQGSHPAFGTTVDSAWYDDAFQAANQPGSGTLGGDMFTDADRAILDRVFNVAMYGQHTGGDPTSDGYVKTTVIPKLDQILAAVQASGGGLTPAQAQELADILAALKGLTLKAI